MYIQGMFVCVWHEYKYVMDALLVVTTLRKRAALHFFNAIRLNNDST